MKIKPRCKTGIEELDSELCGGIPVGSTVLITGASGVGKSTVSMEFLTNGIKLDEKGVFFTTSETINKLISHLKGYDFFDENLIKLNKLSIIDLWNISDRLGLNPERYTAEDVNILFEVIRDITKELGAKRLVVDSITSLCYRLETNEMIRDFIFRLGTSLAAMNCTTILTSEIPPCVLQYSQYGIEEFIADGIIFLEDVERMGDLIRTLQVIKMRGTAHNRTKFVLNLSSKNGVELAPMLKSNVEFKRLEASPSLLFGETSEEEID
jgi:KaiC/GvpD/RAD55 family RecA-like ATPase